MPGTSLLIAGLIFPTVSLLTCIASLITRWRHGRYASPVFIPFVGPALLTCWVLMAGHLRWLIPVVWLLDVGTVAFLFVLPRLTLEWWQLSAFTRLMTLHGAHGIEKVILTLHRGGRYFLRRSWNRAQGELGIVDLGETGTFIDDCEVDARPFASWLAAILLNNGVRSQRVQVSLMIHLLVAITSLHPYGIAH